MNLLILSIGSNPMPNFITAKYLLNEDRDGNEKIKIPFPDKILFIYSSDTAKFKNAIIGQLDVSTDKIIGINLGDKHREFDGIKKEVTAKIKKLDNISTIHLNYTGGTKVMAVAISEAVKEFNCSKTIYSDLSPSKFKLVLRTGNEYPESKTIRDFVKLKVEDVYKLHCLNKPKLKREHSGFYKKEFVDFLFSRSDDYKKNVKFFYDEFWDRWSRKTKLKDIRKDLKEHLKFLKEDTSDTKNNKIKEFQKKLKESLSEIEIKVPNYNEYEKWKELQKFIRGDWLEEYLFMALTEIKEECVLTDLAWNIEAEITNNRTFEIDVIAVRGCETFVFTCTTAYDSKICKGKAFEGIYRSEQLGGEHSKTILVCLADDKSKTKGKDNDCDKTVSNIKTDMRQFDAAKNFYIYTNQIDFPHNTNLNIVCIMQEWFVLAVDTC